jgi:hypothetical protein
MTNGAERTIGRDTVKARIETAKANRNRAIETDSRWNWYVLTIPVVAIGLAMQMSSPDGKAGVVLHIMALVALSTGGITGILGQKSRSLMLSAAADEDIKIAQLSSDNAKIGAQHLMNKLEEAGNAREVNLNGMRRFQRIHYWATGLGLVFLLLQHLYSVLQSAAG